MLPYLQFRLWPLPDGLGGEKISGKGKDDPGRNNAPQGKERAFLTIWPGIPFSILFSLPRPSKNSATI